jgi:hypothetical protein
MKFREAVISLAPAKFNFKDLVAEKEFIEFGPQQEALSVARYRELLEKKINELVSLNTSWASGSWNPLPKPLQKHLTILFPCTVTLQAGNFSFLTCSKILYLKKAMSANAT